MAKFNPILGDLRGSIGANCFSVNRSGAYVRFKASPTQPDTQYQLALRARVLELSKYFSYNLTDTEREAWNAFARQSPSVDRFGHSQSLTGLNWFVKINIERYLAGLSRILIPPENYSVEDLATASLTIASTPALRIAILFSYYPAPPMGQQLFVYATSPIPNGTTFYKTFLRFLCVSPIDQASPYDITQAYVNRFGTPPARTWIYVVVAAFKPANSCKGRGLVCRAMVPPALGGEGGGGTTPP